MGGIIIIGFGAFLILSTKLKSLNIEKRFLPKKSKASYPMSFVFWFGICSWMDAMRRTNFRNNSFLFKPKLSVNMNKRFVIVGILLGSLITIAFFAGSPMFGGMDMLR